MKAPQEGFQKQGELLEGIREGYKGKVDRVYRMSKDQQAVFQSGLQDYNNFGGHGSGTQNLKLNFVTTFLSPQARPC